MEALKDRKGIKEEFLHAFRGIRREGSAALLEWLEGTDFFTAPASTRFHGAYEGGLAEHSVHVYRRLNRLLDAEYGDACPYSTETAAICGLLHDVCKVEYYTVSTRNVKNEKTGQWEKQPFYTVNDRLPYGHGEKSVYILSGFMKLTREEAMAVRWHMGGFDEAVKGGARCLPEVFGRYPLALLLHLADMQAACLDEAG